MMIPSELHDAHLEQRDSAVDLEAFVERDTRQPRSLSQTEEQQEDDRNGLIHAANANDLLERLQTETSPASPSRENGQDGGVPVVADEIAMILAVALIKDAHKGIHSEFKMNLESVRSYTIYNQVVLSMLTYLFICVHHALIFFESPVDNGLTLPYYVTMMLELCCIAYYIFRLSHYSTFVDQQRFLADTKIRMNLALIALIALDLVQFAVSTKLGGHPRRYTRALRPLFIINMTENKQIRRAVRNIRRTLPKVVDVLILFLLTMSIFALISLKLFNTKGIRDFDGQPYFAAGFFENFYLLYVLVTSANNPDVMMPAYYQSKWYFIFFFLYLIVCMYIFLNIILAVVYNNYKEHLRNEVCSMVVEKRRNLRKAFDLLTINQTGKTTKYISFETFQNILNRIGIRKGKTVMDIMWSVLDSSNSNKVFRADFANITEVLSLQFSQEVRRKNIFEVRFPDVYNSAPSVVFRRVVQGQWFRYVFDLLIVLNAILLAVSDANQLELLFITAFVIEILAKLYTFGCVNFFRKAWNVFDFVIIGTALLGSVIEGVISPEKQYKSFIDIILVLRCLRLAKIMSSIKRFRIILMTIGRLLPSMMTFAGILFGVYYAFAVVGMELFAGRIREGEPNCGDARLANSTFVTSHYCANNFNNAASAFVLLFELMVVNQWHILAEGFALVTSQLARIYFVLFHMTCVILVMNIFTAFVIEAFILEIGTNRSSIESRVIEKIREHEAKRCEEIGCRAGDAFQSDIPDGDADHDVEEGSEYTGTQCANHDVRLKYKKSTRFEDLLMRMFNDEVDLIKNRENCQVESV